MTDKMITWLINGWFTLVVLLNIVGIAGLFISARGFEAGIRLVQDVYNPLSLINWVAEIALISPALVLIYWRNRQRKEAADLKHAPTLPPVHGT